jgi:hypothetical protein
MTKSSLMMCAGLIVAIICIGGCSSHKYVTPAEGAKLSTLNSSATEADVQDVLNRRPASPFPVHLVLVRIQSPNYYSYGCQSYGQGRYSVITTKEIETDEEFAKLERLPMISGVGTLSQILIPEQLESDKELRLAAAKLHADMLLVYTLNTSFRVKDHEIGPLGVITLGTLPNQEAQITTTASAVVYDVRSGYTYGTVEATASEKQIASIWSTDKAVDESRLKAEKKAFEQLINEFPATWKKITEEYASKPVK